MRKAMKKTFFPLVVMAFANSVFAQMNLTFDTSLLGNPGLNASNVYLTFVGFSSSMTFDPFGTAESINFAANNITINGTQYGTSKAYSLADIQSKRLVISAADSMVGYISYNSTTGISQLAQGVQPSPFSQTAARWSNFEFTYSSGTGGSADLTNISQYGGSLKMEFRAGNATQGYVQNTLNTGDTFRALAATSTNTSLSTISSGGNFVRVIGANAWPASVSGGFVQTPYQTFEPYLQHLTATYGGNASSTLTNLVTGQAPGGEGAYGYNSTANATQVAQNTSYNLDYHFGSYTTSGTGGNGTSLLLSGYVNATPTVGGGPTVVYGNLTISVAGDSAARGAATQASMTTFLYLESLSNAGVVVDFSGWETLNNDFGTANVNAAIQLKAAGDFAQGILDGFVGSTVAVGNSTIGDLTSSDWFAIGGLVGPTHTGSIAQPSNAYYSQWGNVVTLNSDGYNGGNFTSGMVYGSPYDDRFHVNLINADSTTDEMKITLQPDGNLSLVVPEPTSAILLLGGLGFCFFLRKRALSKLG